MKSIHTRAALTLALLSLVAGCGSENSVVGGRCREGMELSGNTCVAPGPDVTLITPGDPPIGRLGNKPDGQVPGAVLPVGVVPSPFDPDHELPLDPIDPITPPDVTPPELVCAAPLVACHDTCISVESDPLNCGACGKICPSNICVAGVCQGATPGDVVLIGHDFTDANPGSAQTKVLVNALTIPTTDPIRVLSYEDGASPLAVFYAKYLATDGITRRKIHFTRADSASDLESPDLARSYDVVIVHDASAGDAAAVGASWAGSLGGFTAKGGVVVALDRGTSPMPALLSASGLLTVTSHATLPSSTHLAVSGAADVVGAQVLSPYAAFGAPVSFQGLPAPSVDLGWVVRATKGDGSLGDAVVVHRVVRGPS